MAIKSLKKFIFENEKIEFVLESIGCHHVKYNQNKQYYSCGNIDGDNVGAINVYNNEHLNIKNWTRANEFDDTSDIITLTQYNKKCSFIEAVKYLYSILGLEYKNNWKPSKKEEAKFDPLWIFKRVKSRNRYDEQDELQTLKEEVLDEFIPILHIDWFRSGIMPWTAKKFGLAYSYKRKRIVIPHRHWLTGELVGINMRTTVANYEELGIRKYHLTEGYNKSSNLYGLYENYDDIKRAGYVIVMEGEKSVLKNHSRDGSESEKWKERGYQFNGKTCVALSGKTMSEEQVRILIGLNVDIIIALDNDVDINEIRHMCEHFYRMRNVWYIHDDLNLLGEKDSPADGNSKVFNYLFKHKKRYDKEEHETYISSLKLPKK